MTAVPAHAQVEGVRPAAPVAECLDVHKTFERRRGLLGAHETVRAVNGVSLAIGNAETIGLVGESGCGKSTLARLLLGLLPPTEGSVRFDGVELSTMAAPRLKQTRREVQAVFQDPLGSLNPFMAVGEILAEPLLVHKIGSRATRAARVRDVLDMVGLPTESIKRRPSEFSGGQQQRIAIARALVLHPRLLVADEALSALDVSIQAQILNLFIRIQQELKVSFLFISHNLVVVRHIARRVAVMYLGRVVEYGPAEDVYRHPQHPYSVALLSAVPVPDPRVERTRRRITLGGDPPSPARIPTGCPFHTRCWKAQPVCASVRPPLAPSPRSQETLVACHFPE